MQSLEGVVFMMHVMIECMYGILRYCLGGDIKFYCCILYYVMVDMHE